MTASAGTTGGFDQPSLREYLASLRGRAQKAWDDIMDDEPTYIAVEIKPEDLERMNNGEQFRLGIPVRRNAPNFLQMGVAFAIGAVLG